MMNAMTNAQKAELMIMLMSGLGSDGGANGGSIVAGGSVSDGC